MRKNLTFNLLACMLFFGVFILTSGKANAAFADIPRQLPDDTYQYLHLSDTGGNDEIGGGGYLPQMFIKIYANSPADQKLVLHLANSATSFDCTRYSIQVTLWTLNPTTEARSSVVPSFPRTLNPTSNYCSDFDIIIPFNQLTQGRPELGHGGLWVGQLQLNLTGVGDNGSASTFRLIGGGSGNPLGNIGLGYVANEDFNIRPRITSGDPPIYTTLGFRTKCDVGSPDKRLTWRDSDFNGGYNTVQQFGGPNFNVRSGADTGGAMPIMPGQSGRDMSPNNSHTTITTQPNTRYSWGVYNVFKANGIGYTLPYDSADFSLPCPQPDPPPELTNCSRLSVTDQGPQNPFTDSNGDGVDDHSDTYNSNTIVTITDSAGWVFAQDYRVGNNDSHTFDLGPPGQSTGRQLFISISRQYNRSGNWVEYSTSGTQTRTCYEASCTVTSVDYELGPGASRSGGGAVVNGYITNNNSDPHRLTLPSTIPSTSARLSITSAIDGSFRSTAPLNDHIPPGQSRGFSLYVPLPSGRASKTIVLYPDYYGRFAMSGGCLTSVSTYEYFNSSGETEINLGTDFENPTLITATGRIKDGGTAVDAPVVNASLRITRNGATVGTPTSVSGFPWRWAGEVIVPEAQFSEASGVRSLGWLVGDRICAVLSYAHKSGWLGPGDAVIAGTSSGDIESCNILTNRPYVSVYGNDVSADGGGLGEPCVSSGSGIQAYTKSGGAGSGVQLASYALGQITGFKSAFLRASVPSQPSGLTFSNTIASSLGNFGAADCATDYYTQSQYGPSDSRRRTDNSSTISLDGPDISNGGQTFSQPAGGRVTLTDGEDFNKRHTLFVDGDVFIDDNITYANTDGWASIASIPYLTIIARGNIYISQSVDKLDGRFIAQPRDASNGGHIYTCTKTVTGALFSEDDLWTECGGASNSRRLVIHGQFVAKTIHFLRTINTLSSGSLYESASSSNAAEVFEFSPEIYLGQPATRPSAAAEAGEYEYITTLPPIL